jgi:hypothetical protein
MKKLIVCGLIALLAAAAGAQTLGTTLSKKQQQRKKLLQPPPVTPRTEVDGVVPRAFQPGGNPLQMINPLANPEKYGTAAQHVVIDPETGKWKGIKLFTILF